MTQHGLQFKTESEALQKALGRAVISIDHIGSTSVPWFGWETSNEHSWSS